MSIDSRDSLMITDFKRHLDAVMKIHDWKDRKKYIIKIAKENSFEIRTNVVYSIFYKYYNYQKYLKQSREYQSRKAVEKLGHKRKVTSSLRIPSWCKTPADKQRSLVRYYTYFSKFEMSAYSAMLLGLAVPTKLGYRNTIEEASR